MIVIKRDGTQVEYDLEKISIAISGAFEQLGKEFNDVVLLNDIEDAIIKKNVQALSVEEIQNIVEIALMDNGYVDEAKAYILYRYNHELARRKKQEEMKNFLHQMFKIKMQILMNNLLAAEKVKQTMLL